MTTAEDIDTVARTAWGEARNQGVDGMQCVINVIANRVKKPSWWGKDWVTVCRKPWQFSCWNENDPNRKKLLGVTEFDTQFKQAKELATKAIAGSLPDLTNGGTHYHTIRAPKGVQTWPPIWAKTMVKVAEHGDHIFYR